MKHYMLTIYQPDGEVPGPEVLAPVMARLQTLNDQIKAAGAWVFAGGLHAPDTATVIRRRDDEVLTTDGPYVEGKEHIGGFTIIAAPDLDAALAWAGKLADALTIEFDGRLHSLPVEVRPMAHVQT
jgi:hypothetical protein